MAEKNEPRGCAVEIDLAGTPLTVVLVAVPPGALAPGRYRVTFERARPSLPAGARWDGDAIVYEPPSSSQATIYRVGEWGNCRGVYVTSFHRGVFGWVVDAFRADGQLPPAGGES